MSGTLSIGRDAKIDMNSTVGATQLTHNNVFMVFWMERAADGRMMPRAPGGAARLTVEFASNVMFDPLPLRKNPTSVPVMEAPASTISGPSLMM